MTYRQNTQHGSSNGTANRVGTQSGDPARPACLPNRAANADAGGRYTLKRNIVRTAAGRVPRRGVGDQALRVPVRGP